MAGSKKPYSLDEYYKDRYGGQMAVSPLNRTVSRSPGSVRPVSAVHAGAMQRRQQFLRSMNVTEKSKQTTEQTQTTPDTAGGIDTTSLDNLSPEGGALTEKEFNSKLTTADTMSMLEDALASLAEWGNRKFVYNAKESPLYTILQQQAEKEARLASGRAYSRAVANTGGFGSSYATLAAEEAGRQVMEGLDDQQLALYQAAREEFEAERQSRVDWYNTAKQLHSDRMALDELQATEAAATMTLEDGTTVEVTDAARELYAGYLDSFMEGTGYDTLKTAMINGGASEADADQAIAMFKRLGGATVTDQISALEASPTLSGAAEAYLAARQNGTLDRDAAKISAGAKAAVEASLKNAGDDEEAMNTALAEAAQAVKDGYMSESDYVSIITADIHADIKNMESGDEKISDREKRKRVAQSIEGIIEQYEIGNLTDDGYQKALIAMKPYLDKYFTLYENTPVKAMRLKLGLDEGEADAIDEVVKAIENVSKKAETEKERRG